MPYWVAWIRFHILRHQLWVYSNVSDGSLHLYPLGDAIWHEATDECICGPAAEIIPDDEGMSRWFYTHHSLDSREKRQHARAR